MKIQKKFREYQMQISNEKVSTTTKKKLFNLSAAKGQPLLDTVNPLPVKKKSGGKCPTWP